MDCFKVHKQPNILEKLSKLNTDVLFVPEGLTYFIQPLDVYLNAPFNPRSAESPKFFSGGIFVFNCWT